MIFKILFFISLLKNSKLIEIILIKITIKIGIIVQIISNIWFCKINLLLNLFFKINLIIKIRIKIILIKIINMKLWNILILIILIEFGFWKFKFIHDIIFWLNYLFNFY